MDSALKIFYIGLNPETLGILAQNKIHILGVAKLDYFCRFTINPGNLFFEFLYYLRTKRKFIISQNCSLILFNFFSPLLTGVYSQYREYFEQIIKNNISVVNVDDIEQAKTFIKKNNIDLIVLNAWSLLPLGLINSAVGFNIHPSKVPCIRGITNFMGTQRKESGSALLLVNEEIDGGDFISQYSFQIISDDSG
jgi:hypothetical protein